MSDNVQVNWGGVDNVYKAGFDEGYLQGFRDATAQAKAIIERAFPHFEKPAEDCRIHEYDGAFKCLTHQKTWGAISNGGAPCAGFDEKQWYADRDERRGDWDAKNECFTGKRETSS